MNNHNIDTMFSRLKFENKEKEEFDKFIHLKGEYLHKQVYDVLGQYCNDLDMEQRQSF